MTPVEKMELDLLKLHQKEQHSTAYAVPTTAESAAALIRRLAAALQDVMAYLPTADRMAYEILTERHADALRDVKEQA